ACACNSKLLAQPATPDGNAPATYQDMTAEQWGELLSSENSDERRQAAYALGRMGSQAADQLDSLVTALNDDTAGVRRYVAEAIGLIGPVAAKAVPNITAKILSIENAPVPRGERKDRPMQYILARTLGNLAANADSAKPTLEKFLEHEDPILRIEAAVAIWKIDRDERALVQLTELVKEQANPGAMEALLALRELPAEQLGDAKNIVLAGLDSSVPDIQRAAVDIAVRIEPPIYKDLLAAFPAFKSGKLPTLIAIGKLNHKTRTNILYSADADDTQLLANLHLLIRQVVPLLEESLNDEDVEIREAAAFALSELGPIGLPTVLKQTNSADETKLRSVAQTLRWTARKLPNNWGQQPRMQQIRQRLLNDFVTACGEANNSVKLDLFRLLDSFAYKNPVLDPVFRRALQNADPEIRQFAARGLARLSDTAPLTP
ncbi:MAG: HEAT repeat protein, partial [Pirellulaceae bacterium]